MGLQPGTGAGGARRRRLGAALAALVAGAACGESVPTSGAFSALTYNVAGLPEGLSGSMPEVYTPLISPKLEPYDLVLVQEDFTYQLELRRQITHPYRSEPKKDFVKAVNDGLNRFSRLPIGPLERVQWVACHGALDGASDCLAEKGFSVATLELAPGVLIDVYNHHAEAGGSPEDDAARERGYDQLIAHVLARRAASPRTVLIAGDTNLHRRDPEDDVLLTRVLSELGLQDACETLACGDDHIDRFLFRSEAEVELEPTAWRVAREFVTEDGEDLSDHPAIHVDFRWSR